MSSIEKLKDIRSVVGKAQTKGLGDEYIATLIQDFPQLVEVIDEAHTQHLNYRREYPELLKMDEESLIQHLQTDLVNFYQEYNINPYVALVAKGPWLVTLHGAVLHDSGGYGMLGLGHGPESVIRAMGKNYVMANVMTASLSQKRLTDRLLKEIGRNRAGARKRPYEKFLCLNSGSEAVTVAARISDINAKIHTDPNGRHAGKSIKILSLKGSFHGRTERPAQASDSSQKAYNQALASYRNHHNLLTVEPNNVEQLEAAFKKADADNIYIEMMFMEPVMGEGNPGQAVTPEFYKAARRLTAERGTMLMVDSIQAGLRAHGCLSIMDYPGFEELDPPDMETYSKAINAGQYPLSVLAMTKPTAALYKHGVYGNTMTTNPRALEVACAVLDSITDPLRKNIQERGREMVEKFLALGKEFPGVVLGARGTGLLCAMELKEEGYKVVGHDGIEKFLRLNGIGVIHGGKNCLRFTPHFAITSREIDLVIQHIREALKKGPIYL